MTAEQRRLSVQGRLDHWRVEKVLLLILNYNTDTPLLILIAILLFFFIRIKILDNTQYKSSSTCLCCNYQSVEAQQELEVHNAIMEDLDMRRQDWIQVAIQIYYFKLP